jgi:hypothetical protein
MRFFIGLVLTLALGVMGCSDAEGTGVSGWDAVCAGVSGGGGNGGSPTALAALHFKEATGEGRGKYGPPLEGVEVCELCTTNCELTDADGWADLQLPVGQETGYTVVKEGYASTLVPLVMPETGYIGSAAIAPDDLAAERNDQVMSPYPLTDTGWLQIQVWDDGGDGFPGATFELTPPSGKAFYREEDNLSLDLDATTSRGVGGFTEVAPGTVQVTVGGTAENCVVFMRGWPADSENSTTAPVVEGYRTRVRFICDEVAR